MPWLHELADDKPAQANAVSDAAGHHLSYAELRDASRALGARLADRGVRAGDRVLLVGENCVAFLVAALGVSYAGGWLVPVNARMTANEIDAVATHAGARSALFTTDTDAARTHAARECAMPVAPGLAMTAVRKTSPEAAQDTPDEAVAALLYTTGTTSHPKGVMLTHTNLTWNARISAGLRGMNNTDMVLGVLPGTHVFGFSSVMLASLFAGAHLVMLPRFSPEAVCTALANGASVFCGVPQMFERLLAHLDDTNAPVVAPRLKYLSAGGAPLDPDFKARTEARFHLPLNNGYGLTETSPSAAATDRNNPRHDTSVGGAVPETELTIETPNPEGIGELLIRSPGVMKGYYRDAAATRAVLLPDGWFRSGDLARKDAGGALHIVGRTKELIVRGGFNVYPPEVEAMLTRHPQVGQAAVVGRKAGSDEEVIAFVTGTATPEELDAFLRTRLVAYKVPQHIIVVDVFPSAATGKILKHTLLSHFREDMPEAPPQTLAQ